jgi:hypothetical protein
MGGNMDFRFRVLSTAVFALCFTLFLVAPPTAVADSFTISVNTSAIAGASAQLAFDLINGGSASNTVTISDFSTDGTLGAVSPTGEISGTLPGTVTLMDSPASFFNEYLTGLTLGTTISFVLDATTNGPAASSSPDALSVFLLDPNTGLPLFPTSDPTLSDSLFTLNIDGTSAGNLGVYTSIVSATPTSGTPVPEPPTGTLLGGGLAFVIWKFSRRH